MEGIRKNDQGTYSTLGLDEKGFKRVFKLIEDQQRKNRRHAKRTLTAQQLARKDKAALSQLGAKADGSNFTVDDLKAFAANRDNFKKQYDSATDGITFAKMVSGSRPIDIDRANNRVSDGSGITRATLSGIKGNEVLIRVKASDRSKHEEHAVKIRLEEWNDQMHDCDGHDYLSAVKAACKGRMSIACTCGRHQYWYRYQATMGRYAIAPPSEFAFPKIRNPELKGVACKHVLRAAVMLQSVAWQRLLAKQMQIQASRIGFGDDRLTHYTLTEKDKKATSKNRSTVVNQAKAQQELAKEYRQYQRSQAAFERKIKQDEKLAKRAKNAANRARKARLQTARLSEQLKEKRDAIRVMFSMMKDAYSLVGKGKGEVIKDMATRFGVSESKIKAIVK